MISLHRLLHLLTMTAVTTVMPLRMMAGVGVLSPVILVSRLNPRLLITATAATWLSLMAGIGIALQGSRVRH